MPVCCRCKRNKKASAFKKDTTGKNEEAGTMPGGVMPWCLRCVSRYLYREDGTIDTRVRSERARYHKDYCRLKTNARVGRTDRIKIFEYHVLSHADGTLGLMYAHRGNRARLVGPWRRATLVGKLLRKAGIEEAKLSGRGGGKGSRAQVIWTLEFGMKPREFQELREAFVKKGFVGREVSTLTEFEGAVQEALEDGDAAVKGSTGMIDALFGLSMEGG